MNIFDKLAGTRLYDELALMFNENRSIKSLKRLGITTCQGDTSKAGIHARA